MNAITPRSRLRPADLIRLSAAGLRSRRLRAALSATGIAIGIAAVVAILGTAQSSQASLLNRIDRLGTTLLTATDAGAASGQASTLPRYAPAMIRRITGVQQVAATAALPATGVYRSDQVPAIETAGLSVIATSPALLDTLHGSMFAGRFLTTATSNYPVTVLGSDAASTLGIPELGPATRVWIGGHWFAVAGIMRSFPLTPALNRAALIGLPAATGLLGYTGHPATIYIRTTVTATSRVAGLTAASAFPEDPGDVIVVQPTAALAARAAVTSASTALYLGLAAIALLVGGIGIANVMVIAVLERRAEIGIRRALGASRRHIRHQFLAEAVLLAALGGTAGAITGALATLAIASLHGWPPIIPAQATAAGLATALTVGATAGVIPAIRAARLSPTQALRS